MTTTYAVLDLETTGSTYDNGDQIIQIGVAFVQNGQIVERFASDINPKKAIPREITKLTGITNDQVKQAPIFKDVAEILWQKLDNTVIVAHNIGFDYKFIDKSFKGLGFPSMTQDRIDTVEMIRTLYPTADSYKLSEFCQAYGISLENAHTAIDDAEATAEILMMCQEKVRQMPVELFEKMRPFLHYYIGDTGKYLAQWFDQSKVHSSDFEYIAPFVLNTSQANFQTFPEKFGDDQAKRLSSEDDSIVIENHGLQLSALQKNMVAKIHPFLLSEPSNQAKSAFLTANAGVGKSLAYVMSALSAVEKVGKKDKPPVVISTSTVLLQHQFLDKTVRLAANLLGKPLKAVILKGQSHYLQLTRFQKLLTQLKKQPEITLKRDVLISVAILVWLSETTTGDLHELNGGLHNDLYWKNLNAFPKRSHHEEIQHWGDYAFYERHVREAKEAELVILNHAYFVYHYQDLLDQSILTKESKLIIDEGHQLPATVHQQQTLTIKSKVVEENLIAIERSIHRVMDKVVSNQVKVHAVDKLFQVEKQLQTSWAKFDEFIDEISDKYQTQSYYQQKLSTNAYYIAHNHYMIAKWRESLRQAITAMHKMIHPLKEISRQLYQMEIFTKTAYQQLLGQLRQFEYQVDNWLKASQASPEYYAELSVHFGKQNVNVEIDRKLYSTKDALAEIFDAIPSQTLLVSASIEIVRSKTIISNLFGIEDFEWYSFMEASYQEQLDPKSEHQVQGYYLKDYLSIDKYNETQAAGVIADIVEHLWQNKKQMHKIQVFFQSRSLMVATQHELKRRLNRTDYGHLIVQNNQRNVDRLARQYEDQARAILFALASFQEGIHLNTKTDAFLLTRLPFQAPDTPDELAKQDYLKSIGDHYFDDVALPQMLMTLTQIFGRMAATVNDQSIFISLDRRLEKSAYADQIEAVIPDALTMQEIKLSDLE